jgi:uracil-DNA glycosylase
VGFLIENETVFALSKSWNDFFCSQRELSIKDSLKKIDEELRKKMSNGDIIFPKKEDVFKAFQLTNPLEISVVILGQDPYHGEDEAMGLSFSVPKNIKIPPSLKNIFKELSSDLGVKIPSHGDLTSWAKQNVLLLNSILTVKKDSPASHSKIGWEQFTDAVILYLSKNAKPKAFVLWGNFAQSKKNLIDENRHKIIQSSHPSPLSANKGFFGSKPFSQINNFLKSTNQKEINWNLQ